MFEFDAVIWEHDGNAAWHFLTVPEDVSELIAAQTGHIKRGFGSVRVRVTIGQTTWETSVFPESQSSYVLPVKKAVRKAESLEAGLPATVTLTLRD